MPATRIPLSPYDNIMPRIYAYTIFCLPMKAGQEPRNVHQYLEEALSKTVTLMPFLAGTLRVRVPDAHDTRRGRLEIIAPAHVEDRPVQLKFKDLTSILDYDDLMADGLPDDSLDGDILLPTGLMVDLGTGAAVLVAQANFLERGCFLSVGLHHSVGDGAAAVKMMQVWAQHCQQLQSQENAELLPSVTPESLDRDTLERLWSADGNQHKCNAYLEASDDLWRFLGVDSVVDIPKSLNAKSSTPPAPKTETSIFYMSGASLLKLKHAGTANGATGVTANDALMAFLWRSITSARFPQGDPIYAKSETAILDTTFDGRANFSAACPPDYLGNVVLMNTTYLSLASLTSTSTLLSTIAFEIRKSLNTISTSQVHSAMTLAASIPDCRHLTFPFATFAGTELCITSTVNMPLFELNFGAAFGNEGKPESIRSPKSEFSSICRRCVVLPRRTNGGFEILISLVEEEMWRLMANDEFKQYARFCCH